MIPSRVGCHISGVLFSLILFCLYLMRWICEEVETGGKQKISENAIVIEGLIVYSCIKRVGCCTLRVGCICHSQTGQVSVKVVEAWHVFCVSWFLFLNGGFLQYFCLCSISGVFIHLLLAHLGNCVQHITF